MKSPYSYADILSVCSWLLDNEGDSYKFNSSDDFLRALRVLDLEVPLAHLYPDYQRNSIMIKSN